MKQTLFVQLRESPESGYCSIMFAHTPKQLKEKYKDMKDYLKKYEDVKNLDDYKDEFIKVDVEYDGRKNHIPRKNVLKTLEKKGILEKVGSGSLFGGLYRKKNKLKDTV